VTSNLSINFCALAFGLKSIVHVGEQFDEVKISMLIMIVYLNYIRYDRFITPSPCIPCTTLQHASHTVKIQKKK
jgi:hypothetical protein